MLLNVIVLANDDGEYILNGNAIINPYPRNYSYEGITLEYNGAYSEKEKVVTPFSERLQRDLIVQVRL